MTRPSAKSLITALSSAFNSPEAAHSSPSSGPSMSDRRPPAGVDPADREPNSSSLNAAAWACEYLRGRGRG